MDIQKEILLQMVEQSQMDCHRTLKEIDTRNADFRLTEQTASVGFIYRHIGESINLIVQFFGYDTGVEGTTMGQEDTGTDYDLDTSQMLFEQGYTMLKTLVNETADDEWIEEIETAWFGKISRINLFSIVLFHNAHHCGQIASAIAKGKSIEKAG